MLTEQELVRINDVILQQMKAGTNDDIKCFAELKFKNGVKSEKASLDEIIAENNGNQWEIQVLKIGAYNFKTSHPQKTRIEVEFRVPPPPVNKDNTQRPHSISYYILGNERNWVYLTSSQLDDRIAKVKILPIDIYGFTAILAGIILGFLILLLPSANRPIVMPLGYQVIGFFASASLIIGGIAAIYGFPPYSFCWGDNTKKYSNRRTLGLYVINGVIVALVLSIIGGVFGTLFFLK